MEKKYAQKTTPPARYSREGGRRYNDNRKKNGPPFFLIFILILLIAAAAAIIIVTLAGKNGDSKSRSSGAGSQVSAAAELSSQPQTSSFASETSSLSSQPASRPSPSPASAPAERVPEGNPEQLGALLRIGDTGYEYYNFVTDFANQYISAVSDAGGQMDGVTLYDMVIPTSMSVMLPESYLEEHDINSSNQRKAIEEYLYPSIREMNPDVKTVSIFDALKLHTDEYIYFRTDHHWTQLGAYYAYVEFCKAKGVAAVPLDQFDKKEYAGFLGSFYSDDPNTEMENNPDTVEAYVPTADVSLRYTTVDGETYEQDLIADGSGYSSEWLYLIIAAGDQPYEEIVNSDLTDGSSCVVVKESFGNAFIPSLVNHYQTVYVVDYRYYDGDISDLAEEKGVDDVLLLNNISMTRNEDLIDDLIHTF